MMYGDGRSTPPPYYANEQTKRSGDETETTFGTALLVLAIVGFLKALEFLSSVAEFILPDERNKSKRP